MINDKSGSQLTYRPQLTGLKRVLINLKKHLKVVKAMSRRQIGPKICARRFSFAPFFIFRNGVVLSWWCMLNCGWQGVGEEEKCVLMGIDALRRDEKLNL